MYQNVGYRRMLRPPGHVGLRDRPFAEANRLDHV
jgi:hypothetical protein